MLDVQHKNLISAEVLTATRSFGPFRGNDLAALIVSWDVSGISGTDAQVNFGLVYTITATSGYPAQQSGSIFASETGYFLVEHPPDDFTLTALISGTTPSMTVTISILEFHEPPQL